MDVQEHFAGKDPALQAAYDRLLEALRQFGSVREAVKQTSIHLEKNSGFAGVHPRKNYFNLEFRTNYTLADPRVTRELQVSSIRWEHTVKVTQPSDIDNQLIGWLKDAYDQSK